MYFPHRVGEFLYYQSAICQLASYYSFTAWYDYDKSFRMYLAMNPAARWDSFNEEVYNRCIRFSLDTRSTASIRSPRDSRKCFLCGNSGHIQNACHLRAGDSLGISSVGRNPGFHPTGHSQVRHVLPPTATPAPRRPHPPGLRPTGICRYFNQDGCIHHNCRYIHSCTNCGGAHPASHCPSRH